MGRPRKIKNKQEMEKAWEEYKQWCDNQEVLTHSFSPAKSEYVSAKLNRCITYTIEGFCVWLGLARSCFYEYYADDKRYADIVTRIREECEVDARMKFELQRIPERLAPLWMGKYGYTTAAKQEISAGQTTGVIVLQEATDGEP